MKTLDQHNKIRRQTHAQLFNTEPMKNGIECPECKCELLDSNPCVTLTSSPPKKNIHCDNCGYIGYRIA